MRAQGHTSPMKEVDVRHLACPGPVLTLRDLLDRSETEIVLYVADQLARSNVTRFAAARGANAEAEPVDGGGFKVTVTAGDDSSQTRSGEEELLVCDLPPASRPTVVQVTAATMGTGDDDLGELLLRSFIKTQMQLDTKPDVLLFYNAGVRLCCRGSLLIDDLRSLEGEGVEIIACGTCLNYFGLASELEVGRVTDMLEIASILSGAGRLIRP